MGGRAVIYDIRTAYGIPHQRRVANISCNGCFTMGQVLLTSRFIAIHGPHRLALCCEPTKKMATDKTGCACDKRCHTKPLKPPWQSFCAKSTAGMER
jgi:hypothetical protein